jgi:hypothetical protein
MNVSEPSVFLVDKDETEMEVDDWNTEAFWQPVPLENTAQPTPEQNPSPWCEVDDENDGEFFDDEYVSNCSSDSEELYYEEDEALLEKLKREMEREKALKQMEGLSVIRDKLNWLEKVPDVFAETDRDQTDSDFPALGTKNTAFKRLVSKVSGGFLLPNNSTIQVFIRDRTYIEFGDIKCKLYKEGLCEKGADCEYTHDDIQSQKRGRGRVCRFVQQGKECKFTNCKFSHDLYDPPASHHRTKRPARRDERPLDPTQKQAQNVFGAQNTSPKRSPPRVERAASSRPQTEDKKFLLCRNMFKVDDKNISEIGPCKFGNNCIFAHSWNEVRERITLAPTNFYCRHESVTGRCKGVIVTKHAKTDSKGVVRTVIKYSNNPDFRCSKLHKSERVKDFIVRTQGCNA